MNIDKSRLHLGLWYTDEAGNHLPCGPADGMPKGAVYAHSCFPLEITEHIYRVRPDGGYGGKDRVCSLNSTLGRDSGRLAVAMVNSGDYDLAEALAVLAESCERCMNVLYYRYLPDEDGYAEYSEEWKQANTVCEFCRGLDGKKKEGATE